MSGLFVKPTLIFKTREEWLRARRDWLGASDSAAIWGVSAWQSPYSCWWSKVGPFEPEKSDIIQRVGHALESLVSELVTEATGLDLIDPGDFAVFLHPEVKCMGCTPDRLTADGSTLVELKTESFSSAAEWQTRIPLSYQTQLQHAMICCGVDRAIIGVLINSTSFKHHTMRLSESFKRRHIAKCVSFWREYVETKTAPPPDYSKATSQALAKQWTESRDRTIDLPNEFSGLGERYDKLSRVASAIEKRQEEIKNRVKAALGDAQIGRLPDEPGGFQWKGSNGSTRRFTRKVKVFDGE